MKTVDFKTTFRGLESISISDEVLEGITKQDLESLCGVYFLNGYKEALEKVLENNTYTHTQVQEAIDDAKSIITKLEK